MKMSVVIPTYRRSKDLARCLDALGKQTRLPDEVLVVVRDTDIETQVMLQNQNEFCFPLQTVIVTVPGVVAAMNAGWNKAQGDIIASTDDDAAPHPSWLARMEACFSTDLCLAGVGGRDWQYQGDRLKETGSKQIVGRVQWFGRVIGNHHLGVGDAREVDVLKGVNMGFRRAAVQGWHFDERMKGAGAQVHFEMAFTLPLRRRGWKIIYDPGIAVDHFPAQRFDEDQLHRGMFSAIALSNIAHNETLALLEYLLPIQRIVFLVWAMVVGTRECPGVVQVLRFLPTQKLLIIRKWLATMNGRGQGIQSWLQSEKHIVRPPKPYKH